MLELLVRLGLFPEQASTMAPRVDSLYFFIVAVCLFFGTGIACLIVAFSFRYRRNRDNLRAHPIEGSLLLEGLWSFIPFVISMAIFVWGASVYFAIARPPDDALEVFAVGKQWMWKLQHMEGRREINELHIPVGRPVKVTMTSEDVLHSFFVPAFRVKADVIPGRYTTVWFEATRPGKYRLFCTEYCGTEHSLMIGHVVALEPHEYQSWLTAIPRDAGSDLAPAVLGAQVFGQLGCTSCHATSVANARPGMVGPRLDGVYGSRVALEGGGHVLADDNYIRRSILEPIAHVTAGYQPVMPTYAGRVTEEELLGLIAYLKALAAGDDPNAGSARSGSNPAARVASVRPAAQAPPADADGAAPETTEQRSRPPLKDFPFSPPAPEADAGRATE